MYRLILVNKKKRTREYQPSDAGYRAALKATRKFLEQNPQGNARFTGMVFVSPSLYATCLKPNP